MNKNEDMCRMKEHVESKMQYIFDTDFDTRDDLNKLKQWYENILKREEQYVVFAGNSYTLALILEVITGKKMRDSNSKQFITEAALLLKVKEIGEYYKKHKELPSILICVDAITKGIKINQLLEEFENEVIKVIKKVIKKESILDENDIRQNIVKCIKIYVYERIDETLLLLGRYELDCEYITRKELPKHNQLLYDISRANCTISTTNNYYIYTQYLSNSKMETIKDSLKNDDYIYTSYCNLSKQYSKHIYIENGNDVQAILSLRIVEKDYFNSYRIIPFIFLPNMNKEETNIFISKISELIPTKYRHLLEEWKEIKGMRTLNEIITLILSNIILEDFNKKYKIEVSQEDKQWEIEKLARNYNWCNFEETVNMINDIIIYNEKRTIEDIVNILKACKIGRSIMKVPKGKNVTIDKNEQLKIQQRLEDYFYNSILKREKELNEILKNGFYYPTKEKLIRNVRGCCFTLAELNKGYNKAQFQYCMAYLLHMLDLSYISISSYASYDIKVVGYSQFVCTEYLSILVIILKYYLYLPVLTKINKYCEWSGKDLCKEIKEFKIENETVIIKIIEMIKQLEDIGQEIKDYDCDYLDSIVLEPDESRIRYLHRQWDFLNRYGEYLENK